MGQEEQAVRKWTLLCKIAFFPFYSLQPWALVFLSQTPLCPGSNTYPAAQRLLHTLPWLQAEAQTASPSRTGEVEAVSSLVHQPDSKSGQGRVHQAREPLPLRLHHNISPFPNIPQVYSLACPTATSPGSTVQSPQRFPSARGTNPSCPVPAGVGQRLCGCCDGQQPPDVAQQWSSPDLTPQLWSCPESAKSRSARPGQRFVIGAICHFASLGLYTLISLCGLCPSFLLPSFF